MYTYKCWIKLNDYQTTHVLLKADSDWECKALAEALYGKGNVLNYTVVNE